MSVDGLASMRNPAPAEYAARLLQQNWPGFIQLTPADIGLSNGEQGAADFLAVVASLSDAGYLSYEALLLNAEGPILVDATLTARGRAVLTPPTDLAH
ncbi:hypothetical protein [Sphingomonas sp. TDK1]|uniref:hypothetical protein n=1 Tax=Sphingomonas sp. TDK1 TaxID=453247 RepID=UPI0007DA46C0|nr:hypothetical protein [Sphingomonas sp. TDK1]OAN67133.1 hypothetical protein A7X12_00435 [Sphingomonas sp. TDK1]